MHWRFFCEFHYHRKCISGHLVRSLSRTHPFFNTVPVILQDALYSQQSPSLDTMHFNWVESWPCYVGHDFKSDSFFFFLYLNTAWCCWDIWITCNFLFHSNHLFSPTLLLNMYILYKTPFYHHALHTVVGFWHFR